MSNLFKIAIGLGIIGILCLMVVLTRLSENDVKMEIRRAQHEQRTLDFNRNFDSDWNAGMMSFAESEEEKKRIEKKEHLQERRYNLKSKEIHKQIESAKKTNQQQEFVTEAFFKSSENY